MSALRVLTLHQPYASLIALGVKTIETRSQPAPKGLIGQRIAIHAGAKRPAGGWLSDGEYPLFFDQMERCWDGAEDPNGSYAYHWRWRGPRGCIVATAVLAESVPMMECSEQHHHICQSGDSLLLHRPMDDPDDDGQTERDVSDQLPYGWFTPGRHAYVLTDVEPLTTPVPFKGGQGWSRSWSPTPQTKET